MQHFILILAIVLLTSIAGEAQCGKKITWRATHEELIDSSGNVLDRKEDTVLLVTSKDSIHLKKIGDKREAIQGALEESTCEWKEAFKNGKSYYKTKFEISTNEDKSTSTATVTLVGKDGKITA